MKKTVFTVGAILLASAFTTVHAEDTLAKIAETKRFVVAYRESSVPFSYLNGPEKPIGYGVDIEKAIVESVKKKLNLPNLEVSWRPVTSQNRIPLLTNGTIDLECGSTTNNSARGKEVAFAVNYFYTGTRLLVKKDSGIKSFADLKGKRVASTTGTTNLAVTRRYNEEKKLDIDIFSAKDHSDGLLMVESGRASALALDDVVLYGLRTSAKNPADLEIVGDALQVEPYACMLRKDDPKFKALVDETIVGMMKSGEFEKLYRKWFIDPIPPRSQAVGLPMSKELRDTIATPTDKPAT
ncbi:transporter substrate-binding domain-containing protein [Cupriavidus sp. L7L]|uniref:transporter substrate-binding domain-containing protein n=1 Tax=Cupriavidus sp. L7L TaxID=2546443 RepID=UPI001054C2DC|nr:transporter substrate-binding domain-containing protein [Cupriavidus sp. L7L]TDF63209.1 transporter substrate-binding domain-containing protein [Cupriavidus sp. L7L]